MKRTLLPGLLLLLVIGVTARLLASAIPAANVLIITIILGLITGNTYGIPDWATAGVGTHKIWLKVGIVVMGASVALDRVVAAGPTILLLAVVTVATTVLVVELLARFVFSIHEETGSLLAAGSSICGVSAVVAIAESISADKTHIAYAATTVLLFDAVTLFVYPLIGHALDLSSTVFGIWAGLTMLSTGPVTAAGFAFSDTAGQWALVVKLIRNSLIGFAAIAYALHYASQSTTDTAEGISSRTRFLWDTFPKFILGFLGLVIVANLNLLSSQQIASLLNASDWAFLLAFAGLGLEIQLDDFRSTGYRPVLVVLIGLLVTATTTLLVVTTLF
ncbi:YeiH family protein [Natrinema gelatinilyticum]|uniref:YeiH family protein n=1 Tax=Natrinema gelatinilyticum TaxID=2961571 RepID=UPI0020C5A45A|nr:putative sulfate exporter family transporter [Natrinema gelatinilyticum]